MIIPTTDPTMTGFTFAGWYLDENFEQPLNLSSILTKNITLYAKWDKAATGLGTSWEDLAPVSPETTIFSSTPENGACSIWFKGVSGEVKKGDRLRVDFTISSNNLTNYKQFAIKTNAFEADWAGAKKWIDKPTETSLTWGATIVADTDIGDGYHNFAIQIDNQITASTSVEEFEISGLTIRNYGPADEGTIYEALGPSASFVIPKNYEYGTTPDNYSYAKLQNFQYQAPLELSGIKKDSKLKIKIAGSCDMAVPKLKVQIVDISEAAKYWTSVSGDQVVLVEKIEANTDFSNEIELSISSDTDSSSIVIVLAIDKTDLIPTEAEFSKDSKDPTFSLTDFKVVKE